MLFLVPFSPTEPTSTSILTMRCSVYTVTTWDTQIKAYSEGSGPSKKGLEELLWRKGSEGCTSSNSNPLFESEGFRQKGSFIEKAQECHAQVSA